MQYFINFQVIMRENLIRNQKNTIFLVLSLPLIVNYGLSTTVTQV
jgi:hypothetical protein